MTLTVSTALRARQSMCTPALLAAACSLHSTGPTQSCQLCGRSKLPTPWRSPNAENGSIRMASFVELLRRLPIRIERREALWLWQALLPLARDHGLTAYDAAYLDLAKREQLRLATLDHDLQEAGRSPKSAPTPGSGSPKLSTSAAPCGAHSTPPNSPAAMPTCGPDQAVDCC